MNFQRGHNKSNNQRLEVLWSPTNKIQSIHIQLLFLLIWRRKTTHFQTNAIIRWALAHERNTRISHPSSGTHILLRRVTDCFGNTISNNDIDFQREEKKSMKSYSHTTSMLRGLNSRRVTDDCIDFEMVGIWMSYAWDLFICTKNHSQCSSLNERKEEKKKHTTNEEIKATASCDDEASKKKRQPTQNTPIQDDICHG